MSFVGCVAGGVSAGVLLLVGVVVAGVYIVLNLRRSRGHAYAADKHQRKGSTILSSWQNYIIMCQSGSNICACSF